MILTKQIYLKKLACILLTVCMIIGLMPTIALPARAADDTNTIGTLVNGESRYGNGWAWDGDSTLTLYGAKIAAGSDNVFTYSGSNNITVELAGYNEVSSTAAFAAIGRNALTISGSGILNIDCPLGSDVVVNSGYIYSTGSYLVSTGGQSYLTINGGYVSASGTVEYSRVAMNKGCLDIESIGANADVYAAGGYLKVNNVAEYGAIKFMSCVVNITGTIEGTVTAENSYSVLICPTQAGGSVDVGMLGQMVTSDGRNIYCNEFVELDSYNPVPAATVIDEPKAGVFCRNPVNIVDGGSFSCGNYFEMPSGSYAITASGTGSAITADYATIVTSGGNGINLTNAKLGANNTVVTTTGGNNTGITLRSSSTGMGSVLIAADSSAYLTSAVSSAGSTDGSVVDGEAYVFSNCHSGSNQCFTLGATANMTIRNSSDKSVKIADGAAINGSLTYASTDKNLTISQNAVITDDSKIAAYVGSETGCNIFNSNDRYISTHTFYYAEDIGSEFKTTTDTGFSCHKAKAVYYGKELQPRLDADEYKDSSGKFVSSAATMSAGENPYADESGLFVISSSANISSPSGELTASLITPYGKTSENAEFTFENGGNGNSKRILVKMKLSGTLIPGDGYKVRVEHDGKTCEFPLTLTNMFYTPEMDFTAGNGAWEYQDNVEFKSFTGKDTNVNVDNDNAKWKWYGAPANDDGYDQYTLVLNDFNGMCDHPIKLPAGSTIILLDGYNTLTTQGCGILCEGGNLTITRDNYGTGPLIIKAGENGDDTSAIKVTGGDLKIDGVTVDISVESANDTQCDNYAVYAESSFVIHDAIVTLNNLNTASGDAVRATEMFLGGTSTLTAQAHENIISSFFRSVRATSIDNVTCFSKDPTLDEYNESCEEDSDSPWLSCTDKTKPLIIETKGLTVDKATVHLPVNTGNTWNVLNDYLTINGGSGIFVLSDKAGAINKLKNTSGVTSIKLSNGVITAEFTEDFAGGEDNAITLYLNELYGELRGNDVPIKVIFDRYYTVTANSTGSGSVTFADGYTSDTVVSGGSIAYDIIPVAGNKITKITYNGEDFTDQFDKYRGGTLTLADIKSDGTLNVEFAPLETFKLDVECDDSDNLYYDVNGTFNQLDGYTEGTELTVSFVPEPDWAIKTVTLNGVKLPLTADNKCTFTITENSTLYVEMEYLIKTVTVNKTGDGTATSSADTVAKGGDVEFTVIPADGWRIGSAKLNNVDVKTQIGADGKLMASNVTEDITLDVVFAEISKCALDVTIPHGSYTADPAGLSYMEGTQVTVTLTPEINWEITAVTLNGTALTLTEDNKYTFTITEDSKLVAEMENLIKTVTVNKTGEGRTTQSNESVLKGDDVLFTVFPADGWRLKSAELNGKDVMAQIDEDGVLMVSSVTEDITLDVVFEKIPEYTLTVPEISHGSFTVSPAGPTYREGTEVTVSVSAGENWVVSSVVLNGRELPLTENNKYSFIMSENVVFEVKTECLLRTVTVVCGAGGKVSPENAEVLRGTKATFSITPDTGYKIASVKLNGVTQTVRGGMFTLTVTENCTLTVEFAKNGGNSGNVRPPRRDTASEQMPYLNGTEKSWSEIAAELNNLSEDSVIISLNGDATVPADVIGAIRNAKLRAEFVVDGTKRWIVDGSKLTNAASADFSSVSGNADRSVLRGVLGVDLKITGTGVPAALKLNFRKEFSGQFANVYKLVNNKPVFQCCAKISEDGSAVISDAYDAGEYIVMVCEFSDLCGDANNDGVLNALDAAAILRNIVGLSDIANPLMGDFNNSIAVNALDASAILKYIVGKAA